MQDFLAIKEQIRARVDLVDLVSEHTALKRRGRNLLGLCPFHQEKTPSFTVNAERQFYKCFGCGAGGDIFTFVQKRESVEFPEALRLLADRAGVDLAPARGAPSPDFGASDLARVNEWAFDYFRKQLQHNEIGRNARTYLAGRGLSSDVVDQFGLGLAPGSGNEFMRAAERAGFGAKLMAAAGLCRTGDQGDLYDTFRQRLMFPIRDATRRCVGFGGRTLADDRAKYLNTPETPVFSKSKCLYGIDLARKEIESTGFAIVVEGYTDCMAAHQHGFGNTVATLGTAATEQHMVMLRRYCDQVVLLFDSDAAGQAAADRALAVALKQNLVVKLAHVPGEKDPCDYLQNTGEQGFRSLLNSALDALVFKWQRTCDRFASSESPGARREAVAEFVRLVAELCEYGVMDGIQQGVVISQLANLLSVPADRVRQLLVRRTSPRRTGEPAATRSTSPKRTLDGEQAALEAVLEILVNEPGLYARVSDVFASARFANPVYRMIAGRVTELADRVGEFSFAELQSLIEDPAEAEALTDLAIRGSDIGDYETRLNGAAARLSQIDSATDTRRLTSELKAGTPGDRLADAAGVRERLMLVGRQLAGRSHFLSPRARDEHGGSEAADGVASDDAGRHS